MLAGARQLRMFISDLPTKEAVKCFLHLLPSRHVPAVRSARLLLQASTGKIARVEKPPERREELHVLREVIPSTDTVIPNSSTIAVYHLGSLA